MRKRVEFMSLGKRLRELRLRAGLSQTAVAKLTGVSRNAVSQWEADATQPSTKRLTRLARAYNVPIDEIMAPSAEARERTVELAARLFATQNFDDVSVDDICEHAEISKSQFDTYFGSKDAVLYGVARSIADRALLELRRRPPKYGTLATRIKYTLHHFYGHDLEHVRIAAAMQAYSWRWSEAHERENNRALLEWHGTIIDMFDTAASQGEVNPGNFRAASSLLLAAYQLGLRRAIYDKLDPDAVMALIEPQLLIVLKGFEFRVVPGFAEDQD